MRRRFAESGPTDKTSPRRVRNVSSVSGSSLRRQHVKTRPTARPTVHGRLRATLAPSRLGALGSPDGPECGSKIGASLTGSPAGPRRAAALWTLPALASAPCVAPTGCGIAGTLARHLAALVARLVEPLPLARSRQRRYPRHRRPDGRRIAVETPARRQRSPAPSALHVARRGEP